jgi:hypothetical protein
VGQGQEGDGETARAAFLAVEARLDEPDDALAKLAKPQ